MFTVINCPRVMKVNDISKINEYEQNIFISERNQNQRVSIHTKEIKENLHRVIDIKCLKYKSDK